MKKQLTTTLAATAALLAIAGGAHAAVNELNIYGASAQYDFWNANAVNYANKVLGCPLLNIIGPVNNASKHGFVSGTGCTNATLVPTGNIEIRYSGIASAEGPLSVGKQAPLDATLLQADFKADGTAGDGLLVTSAKECVQANGERAMYKSGTQTICKAVMIGTSDVPGSALKQTSSGQKLGPMGGGAFSVTNLGNGVSTANLVGNTAVVVPFGFFVNAGVTAQKCTGGLIGNYCADATNNGVVTTGNSQCNTKPSATDGVCGAASTITNISREQAIMIFSTQVADWSDFGAYFPSQQIQVCYRHAGSGTHSTLDFAVVNAGGTGWGGGLPSVADPVGAPGGIAAGGLPKVYFNQGSGDMLKCINGMDPTHPTGQLLGAIGYSDADAALGVAGSTENVKQLAYNGFYPTRTVVRNGLYDFYSPGMLYTYGAPAGITASVIAFAKDPANIPANKVNYWATSDEMAASRADVTAYPGYTGATTSMLP